MPHASPEDRLPDEAGALPLGAEPIGIAHVVQVARGGRRAVLAPECVARLDRAREVLAEWSRDDRPVYGLTRGLGNRATLAIPAGERAAFSEAMLRGRAAGAGGYFADDAVRAALFVRAATLARGGAGVRPVVVQTQLAMLERGVVPLVPRIGSVGASDLALCANMALPLIGLGRARLRGELLSGAEAMARAGVPTLQLADKEGLALCGSNAVSVGLGALVLHDAAELLELADATLAMTCEAFVANPSPFDARVARARPAPGQEAAASHLRALLHGSALFESGVPRRVQDPISLRCATQVHGAVRTALGWAREGVEIELNAAADNPLILPDDGEILSTGNFHAPAMAIAFDALRLALAQLGSMASERAARLNDPELTGLPHRLARDGTTGTGTGLVALVARTLSRESRHCSAPAANDDVTPSGVEDEAPFTLVAVRRTHDQIDLLRQVLACEMIVAAQAIDLRPLARSAPAVAALHGFVRDRVAFIGEDRSTTEDIEVLADAIRRGDALARVRSAL